MSQRYLIIYILAFFLTNPQLAQAQPPSDTVVKIFVTSNTIDYYRPWQSHGIKSSTGSGCIIKGNKILTNAHVVADQTFIQVKKNNDSKKYVAKVEALGHDCDLALLTVEDKKFFNDTPALELGDLPKLQDSVTVLGFPQGGDKLSITEGVVSRLEMTAYSESSRKLLTVQIDAAINAGNSGGPVIQNDKLVGIAMQVLQTGQNIGYMIPTPIIEHFLSDLKDSQYDGFPIIGVDYATTENLALRKYYNILNKDGGVLITSILPFSPSEGLLKEGDVVLYLNNVPIDEDGTFKFRDDERLAMPYLITQEQMNKNVTFHIMRDGKEEDVIVNLKPYLPLIPYPNSLVKPPYYIYGGLVFTILSTDLIKEWGEEWWNEAPIDLLYYLVGTGRLNKDNKREIVILLNVLSDDINVGYHNFGNDIVEKVNGKSLSSFKEFVGLLNQVKKSEQYTIIDFENKTRLVLDNAHIDQVDQEIIKRNNIPQSYSADVAEWLKQSQ